jgi:hypothetical protein
MVLGAMLAQVLDAGSGVHEVMAMKKNKMSVFKNTRMGFMCISF